MKKYRHFVNILLISILLVSSAYAVSIVLLTDYVLTVRNYIGIGATIATFIVLFKNRNLFTLMLGITLLIGNFCGLSSFLAVYTYYFIFKIGSLPIPLYWGNPIYSILLIIHLVFNKGVYIAITEKKYWDGFLTRTEDIERIVKPAVEIVNAQLSADRVEEFKKRYTGYTIEQLIEISNEPRYSQAAKMAAAELIAERKTNETEEGSNIR